MKKSEKFLFYGIDGRTNECLKSLICPKCGGPLKHETGCGGITQDDDKYDCPKCGWYIRG